MALVTEARKAKSSSARPPVGRPEDRRAECKGAPRATEITRVTARPRLRMAGKGSKYLVGNFNEDHKFHEHADQIVNPICRGIYVRVKPIDQSTWPRTTAKDINDIRVKQREHPKHSAPRSPRINKPARKKPAKADCHSQNMHSSGRGWAGTALAARAHPWPSKSLTRHRRGGEASVEATCRLSIEA